MSSPNAPQPTWATALAQSQPTRALNVPVYRHEVIPSERGRVVESDTSCRKQDHAQMIFLHPDLLARLDAQTKGSRAGVICALVDWALDNLQSQGQMLVSKGD